MRTIEALPVTEVGPDEVLDQETDKVEATAETAVETPQEASVEASPAKVELPDDPFAKGRQRMASWSKSLSAAKENTTSWFSKAGKKLSKLWSGTKSAGKEVVAGVLSADVLAKQGAGAVAEGVAAAGQWKDEKMYDAAVFVDSTVDKAFEWGANAKAKATEFARTKSDWLKNFGLEKIDLAKDVVDSAQEMSVESLANVTNSLKARFDKLKAFARDSVEMAAGMSHEIKERYQMRKINTQIKRMKAEVEKLNAKREAESLEKERVKNAAKLEKERIDDLEFNIALAEEQLELKKLLISSEEFAQAA